MHAAIAVERATPATDGYPSPWRAGFVLALLVLAILNSYVGRQVPTLLVAPIQAAFGLSDLQIGLLQGVALNTVSALATLPLAFLIDRGNRMRLIWVSALIWSTATAASGLTQSFAQLFACRMVVGIAEATLVPATYSLIADLYRPAVRARATLIYYGTSLVGASLGIALIGTGIRLIDSYAAFLPTALAQVEAWRLSFLAAGAAGLPLLALWLLAREPERQKSESPIATTRHSEDFGAYLRHHWTTVLAVCGGIVAIMVGVEALLTWTPTILSRSYGIAPGRAGEWLGLLWGGGSVLGVLVAWLINARYAARWGVSTPLHIVRAGGLAAAIVLVGLLLVRDGTEFMALVALYFLVVFVAASVGPVLITSIAPGHLHARIFALWVVISAIASGISPVLVGGLSDRVFQGPDGLRLAVAAVTLPCAIAGYCLVTSMRARFGSAASGGREP